MNENTVSPTSQIDHEVVPENGTKMSIVSLPAEEIKKPNAALVISTSESEALRYNPENIATYYSSRPLKVLRRIITVLTPAIRFALGIWWDSKRGIVVKNDRRRAIQLRQILTRLGPAYIKIGQALSTRPDLVPPTYLEELTQLQDKLPPFPNEIAYQFIQEELGAPPEEIYTELSSEPIAAASLGQVYKGKLST
ncbi:hypothetical protein CBP27_01705, partial [Fischerella thermalis WC542]